MDSEACCPPARKTHVLVTHNGLEIIRYPELIVVDPVYHALVQTPIQIRFRGGDSDSVWREGHRSNAAIVAFELLMFLEYDA